LEAPLSVNLLILGLLKAAPLHGYEIKRIIETRMTDWSHISVGSIYFALETMETEKLIAECDTVREGNRPSRTVYEITESGKGEFARLLREVWAMPEAQRFTLDFGLAFMDSLEPGELQDFLKNRIRILEGTIAGLSEHKTETIDDPDVPRAARFIFSHHEAHLRAELEWTKRVLEDVENR
jgi:DNA-binding PadR family transcriptional regulator